MAKSFTDVLYIRKRERKSLLMVLSLLLFSSFSDDIYIAVKSHMNAEKPLQKLNTEFLNNTVQIEIDNSQSTTVKEIPTEPMKTREHHETIAFQRKTDSTRAVERIELAKIPTKQIEVAVKTHSEKKMPVDPNIATVQELVNLGVEKYAAENWVKFTNAGAKIHSKSDLEKIYGLESKTLEDINHLMMYPVRKNKFRKKALMPFDINSGVAGDFASIPGIGKILSERIVKFRDKLGGFHSTDQLLEVYGIVDTVILKHEEFLEINVPVKKININSGSEKELSSHPYINYKAAKVIVNFRKQHGSFSKPEDLEEIRIFDRKWINKISSYLTF